MGEIGPNLVEKVEQLKELSLSSPLNQACINPLMTETLEYRKDFITSNHTATIMNEFPILAIEGEVCLKGVCPFKKAFFSFSHQ